MWRLIQGSHGVIHPLFRFLTLTSLNCLLPLVVPRDLPGPNSRKFLLQEVRDQEDQPSTLTSPLALQQSSGNNNINNNNYNTADPSTSEEGFSSLGKPCNSTRVCLGDFVECDPSRGKCVCSPGFIPHSFLKTICRAQVPEVIEIPKTDPTMIGVVIALVLMSVTLCVVMRLFAKARFRETRTIFNTANPRLMNVRIQKGPGTGPKSNYRRGSTTTSLGLPRSGSTVGLGGGGGGTGPDDPRLNDHHHHQHHDPHYPPRDLHHVDDGGTHHDAPEGNPHDHHHHETNTNSQHIREDLC